jgi:sodium/potassium-transporting ATPase subunit alpha
MSATSDHRLQIDDLTEQQWENILSKEEIIFARTSPKHKLEIVKRAQARGHVVGVTGDGVNDSPALKKADLGIAMNISGSDVSKEAASMVLLDDNFASTVHGIEQGRLIFQNLKKSVQYTITHTMPEVMANLLYVVVPLPLPLSAILIIFVDLGFEMGIALSYAWEVPESKTGLMKVLPKTRKSRKYTGTPYQKRIRELLERNKRAYG